MRGIVVPARRLVEGDVVQNGHQATVTRLMGVQGRKPKCSCRPKDCQHSPLMRVRFDDGDTITVREKEGLRVIR